MLFTRCALLSPACHFGHRHLEGVASFRELLHVRNDEGIFLNFFQVVLLQFPISCLAKLFLRGTTSSCIPLFLVMSSETYLQNVSEFVSFSLLHFIYLFSFISAVASYFLTSKRTASRKLRAIK